MLKRNIRLILIRMSIIIQDQVGVPERFKFNPFQGWIPVRVFNPKFHNAGSKTATTNQPRRGLI